MNEVAGALLRCLILVITSLRESVMCSQGHALGTYRIVGGLLILVALLVVGSLRLVGSALLVGKSLPPLTQDLANLTYWWRE